MAQGIVFKRQDDNDTLSVTFTLIRTGCLPPFSVVFLRRVEKIYDKLQSNSR